MTAWLLRWRKLVSSFPAEVPQVSLRYSATTATAGATAILLLLFAANS
jgi:hypothetical protein